MLKLGHFSILQMRAQNYQQREEIRSFLLFKVGTYRMDPPEAKKCSEKQEEAEKKNVPRVIIQHE